MVLITVYWTRSGVLINSCSHVDVPRQNHSEEEEKLSGPQIKNTEWMFGRCEDMKAPRALTRLTVFPSKKESLKR